MIYETHVKGLTKLHPEVPEEKRGTYSGLSSPKIIRYLKDLGISAIELLPIHHHVDNKFLVTDGLEELLGLQYDRLFCSGLAILQHWKIRGAGEGVQGHG